jgi:hypothetical protein
MIHEEMKMEILRCTSQLRKMWINQVAWDGNRFIFTSNMSKMAFKQSITSLMDCCKSMITCKTCETCTQERTKDEEIGKCTQTMINDAVDLVLEKRGEMGNQQQLVARIHENATKVYKWMGLEIEDETELVIGKSITFYYETGMISTQIRARKRDGYKKLGDNETTYQILMELKKLGWATVKICDETLSMMKYSTVEKLDENIKNLLKELNKFGETIDISYIKE